MTSITLMVGFFLNKTNIVIRRGWRAKIEENRKLMKDDLKYILEPLEP